MSEWQQIGLAQDYYVAKSPTASAQRLVNMIIEQNPQGAKSPFTAYPRPGLAVWGDTIGDGPCRGALAFDSYIYVVSGQELYRVDSFGVGTLLGTINGTHYVRMIRNATQVAIATENELYVWTGSALLTMALSGFNGAAYIDGYGIFSTAGDEKFYITATDDFTSMSALDFSSADSLPDILVGCSADKSELLLFGETSVEWWYNSGNASFPFQRTPGGRAERGCRSSGSIKNTGQGHMWLGNDLRVYIAQGYVPIPVSTPPIEDIIKDQEDSASCEASSFTLGGRTYYALSFSDKTIVYELNSRRWMLWESPSENRFRGVCSIQYSGLNIFGDFDSGVLYELDSDTYSDAGTAFDRIIDTATINGNGRRVVMDELFIDAQCGVGLDGGVDGSDPQLEVSWSDDGGQTWSNPRLVPLGQIGEYRTRPIITRLGSFYQRVLRIRNQDPVLFAITGAHARLEAWE